MKYEYEKYKSYSADELRWKCEGKDVKIEILESEVEYLEKMKSALEKVAIYAVSTLVVVMIFTGFLLWSIYAN